MFGHDVLFYRRMFILLLVQKSGEKTTLGCKKNLANNRMNYTYQVVQDFFHQQYFIMSEFGWLVKPTQLMCCWEASHIGARFQMA